MTTEGDIMSVRVRTSIDQRQLEAWFGPGGPPANGLLKAAGRARDMSKAIITAEGRIDTGQMRNAITSELVETGFFRKRVVARVTAWADHAVFQHEGTANDGAGYIYPVRARLLGPFRPKGSRRFIMAPRVRGVKGIRFLKRAVDRLTPADFV
jgi:hypothetical protein